MSNNRKKYDSYKTIINYEDEGYTFSNTKKINRDFLNIYESSIVHKEKNKDKFSMNALTVNKVSESLEDFNCANFKELYNDILTRIIEENAFIESIEKIEKAMENYFDIYQNSIINSKSFINLLYILPSKNVRSSSISVDNETGRFVLYYEYNRKNFKSKKVSITINERDFTFSILSRKGGLAQVRGVCAFKFPVAYYKIDSLFEAFQDDGYA